MFVRFTKAHKGHKPGQTADLPEDQARAAIDAGAAEEGAATGLFRQVEEKGGRRVETVRQMPMGEGEGDQVMILKFRHGHSVGGESFAPGQKAAVKVDDEAWAAVNEGHADLDPPPGVAGQPFPPEEVRRDDASDVPAQMTAIAAQQNQLLQQMAGSLNQPRAGGMVPAATTTPKPVPAGRSEPNPANQPPAGHTQAQARAAVEEGAKAQAKKDAK